MASAEEIKETFEALKWKVENSELTDFTKKQADSAASLVEWFESKGFWSEKQYDFAKALVMGE